MLAQPRPMRMKAKALRYRLSKTTTSAKPAAVTMLPPITAFCSPKNCTVLSPNHVGLVQRRLDLVHDAERRGVHLQNGEVQGDGHKGLFAAGAFIIQ